MRGDDSLGVGHSPALIGFCWGDLSTNPILPFWAIPLLGIAGLKFRDSMGFGLI